MEYNLRVVFWNVRGLNCPAKRAAIRSVISDASLSIVCMQESKFDFVSSVVITETLGPLYDGFFFLPASGTRGGIILAWRSSEVTVANPMI